MAICGEIFERTDFTVAPLPSDEFVDCTFNECNLSGTHLTNVKFIECAFNGCNLSLVKLGSTLFSDTSFTRCKMLGLQFQNCNQLGFTPRFTECIMDNCSFFRVKMKGETFTGNRFREADFSEADFGGSAFDNCDFTGAMFDGTNLEKADLSTSHDYTIDPETNKIRKAKFSLSGLPGLLAKYDIKIGNIG